MHSKRRPINTKPLLRLAGVGIFLLALLALYGVLLLLEAQIVPDENGAIGVAFKADALALLAMVALTILAGWLAPLGVALLKGSAWAGRMALRTVAVALAAAWVLTGLTLLIHLPIFTALGSVFSLRSMPAVTIVSALVWGCLWLGRK